MSNKYFRFKQFTVYQDKTAMKVGIESVLLGAWANTYKANNIIDIGTGTGLLSLMLAQKSEANITAVEIDNSAAKQAQENFNLSPWYKRINLIHASIQNFSEQNNEKFDLAICNPPYFNNTYQSPNKSRNTARQNNQLTLSELFLSVKKIISVHGKFYLIYPYLQKEELLSIASEYKLYPNNILEIKASANKAVKRIIVSFSGKNITNRTNNLTIYNNNQTYSSEFIELTKDFYLYL